MAVNRVSVRLDYGGGEEILMGCHSLSVSSFGCLLWVSGEERQLAGGVCLFVFTLLLHVGEQRAGRLFRGSWIGTGLASDVIAKVAVKA